MIITDGVHIVSTESEAELHEFVQKLLGFLPEWYQGHPEHPHYDLTCDNAYRRALKAGAVKVSGKELVRQAWWARQRP